MAWLTGIDRFMAVDLDLDGQNQKRDRDVTGTVADGGAMAVTSLANVDQAFPCIIDQKRNKKRELSERRTQLDD